MDIHWFWCYLYYFYFVTSHQYNGVSHSHPHLPAIRTLLATARSPLIRTQHSNWWQKWRHVLQEPSQSRRNLLGRTPEEPFLRGRYLRRRLSLNGFPKFLLGSNRSRDLSRFSTKRTLHERRPLPIDSYAKLLISWENQKEATHSDQNLGRNPLDLSR